MCVCVFYIQIFKQFHFSEMCFFNIVITIRVLKLNNIISKVVFRDYKQKTRLKLEINRFLKKVIIKSSFKSKLEC
jgi:hypothetical protein